VPSSKEQAWRKRVEKLGGTANQKSRQRGLLGKSASRKNEVGLLVDRRRKAKKEKRQQARGKKTQIGALEGIY